MRYIPTKQVIRFSKWKLMALKFPFFIGIDDAQLPNQVNALPVDDDSDECWVSCPVCLSKTKSSEEMGVPLLCSCGVELGYSHGNEW